MGGYLGEVEGVSVKLLLSGSGGSVSLEMLHIGMYLAAWEGCLIGFQNFAWWSRLEVTLDNIQFGDCSSALYNYTESEFNVDSWHVLN